MSEQAQMPLYRSHKQVRALEIAKITRVGVDYEISFQKEGYAPVKVEPAFFARAMAQPLDFYIVYPDGYQSWSPAKAFLEGYSPVA